MAESLLTQQPTGTPSISRLQEFTNSTGATNYDAMAKRIQDAASATRKVEGADTAVSTLNKYVGSLPYTRTQFGSYQPTQIQQTGKALIGNLQTDIAAKQQQASKAASALEQKGQSSIESLRRLDAFGEDVAAKGQQAHQSWETAAAQAKDYVATAEYEVSRTMKEMTDAAAKIGQNLDFTKAHDMQVTAQAVLGSMKQAEDAIRVNGDPNELQQFLQMKGQSLALAQSQLQAQYGQLQTTIDAQMAQAKFTSKAQFQQYVGYNQQNHVQVLSSMAASDAQYAIQQAQTTLAIEQTRISINDSFADFLGSTPTFAIDLQPMLMAVNELAAEASGAGGMSVSMDTSSWGKSLGQLGTAPDAAQINANARSNATQKRATPQKRA